MCIVCSSFGVKTKENANNTFLASIALAIKEEEKKRI